MISSTLFLYIFILVFTTLCAKFSQQKTIQGTRLKMGMLVLAFLTHWIFCSFTNIGVDYERYIYIISNDSLWRFLRGEEIGFNGLSYILFKLTNNADVCIFIFKTVTLLIFYYGFYLLRKHAHLWLCIMAFNVHTYFSGFYIIAMQIAVALVFLSAVFSIIYNSKYIPVLLSIIAATFHTSAILMVACFLFIMVLNHKNKNIGKPLLLLLGLLSLVVLSQIQSILSYFLSNSDFFEHYEGYGEARESEGSGLFNYFLYIFFLVIIIPIIKSRLNSHVINSILVFYGFCFMFAIMGYSLSITRLNFYNVVLLDVSFPYLFYQRETNKLKLNSLLGVKVEKFILLSYLFFLGFVSLRQATSPLSTSMLYDYIFFNPFQ